MGSDEEFALALKLLSSERCDDALRLLEGITEKAPAHERAWCARGACLLKKGKGEAALACFNRAISLDGEDYFPFQEKGKCLLMAMRFKEAEGALVAALRLNPAAASEDRENKADSLFLLSFCQMLLGDSESSSASIGQAFETDPSRTYESAKLLFEEVFAHAKQVDEGEKEEVRKKLDYLLENVVKPVERMRKMRIRRGGA